MARYAAWECKAVARERGALERARDARMGQLDNPEIMARFDAAHQAFESARLAHVAATDCDDMH